jgi:branched-subunit amino acid ABC-type transport system permease component
VSFSLLDALTSFLLAPQPWDNPELFFDQAVAGLATGSIYGLVALGIVLIYRSTDAVNFAQGEMALFVTFIGWSLVQADLPYVVVFVLVLALAGALGAFVERTVIRPVEGAPVLNIVIVTLGLFVIFNSLTAFIYAQGELPKSFPATPIGPELETFDFGILTLQTRSPYSSSPSLLRVFCTFSSTGPSSASPCAPRPRTPRPPVSWASTSAGC